MMETVYEAQITGKTPNRKGIKDAREMFDAVFEEITRRVVEPFWRSVPGKEDLDQKLGKVIRKETFRPQPTEEREA